VDPDRPRPSTVLPDRSQAITLPPAGRSTLPV
jgi:hypothetical protein